MKNIFSLILVIQLSLSLQAQNESISISVVVPKQQVTMDKNTFSILKSKVESAMSRSGISTAMYSGIVLYPILNIYNQQTIEGGMRSIHTIEVELNLQVKQVITETLFNSYTQNYRGEGYSVEEAKRNAISKIDPSDSQFNKFIVSTQTRIINYYRENTPALITKAKTLASMQQYSEALALLSTYPESLGQYTQITDVAVSIFKQYQKKNCAQLLQQAKSAYALGNYEESATILSQIDTDSPCEAEAKNLIGLIKKAIDKENTEASVLYQKEKDAEYSLKKQTIQAIKEVAKSYFSNQPTYYYLF